MRKWLLGLFVLIVGLSQVATAENILTNGGFESLGWNVFGNAGRETWSTRSEAYGIGLYGWDESAYGGIYQDVPSVGLGPYTFSIFVLQEANFLPTTFDVKLEWYAADQSTKVQEDTVVSNAATLPRDGFWHDVYVSGVATAQNLAYVRPVVYSAWVGAQGGAQAVMMDDAALYTGTYVGVSTLSNPSFELGHQEGTGDTNGIWRGSQWMQRPEGVYSYRKDWAPRSGRWGTALFGWDAMTNATTSISQPLTPGTGTYTFTTYMSREDAFLLHEAEVRLEWYGTNFAKIQPDSVTSFTVPNDNIFREYHVTGTCTSNDLYEVRPVIYVKWSGNPDGSGGKAARIDDARFFRGEYASSIEKDWGYHNGAGANPEQETVPGLAGKSFRMVNYSAGTNTVYVLANHPTLAKTEGDTGEVGIRIAWERPEGAGWSNTFQFMTQAGTTTISDGTPFHGQPVSGTKTVDVWKFDFSRPLSPVGVPYTNRIKVFYAPFFRTTNETMQTDFAYLIQRNGELTNNLGQQFDPDFAERDYSFFYYKPTTFTTLSNGNFETPAAGGLDNASWSGTGGAGRETWAARSDSYGGFFPTWDPGEASLYQDIATTGGVYLFSTWIMVQPGAQPTNLQLRMEWYNKEGAMVAVHSKDLLGLPRTNRWNNTYIAGACHEPNLDYVRVMILGQYLDGTAEFNEAILVDDAVFSELSPTLLNTDFTDGYQNLKDWFGFEKYLVGQEQWANYAAGGGVSNGAAFIGWEQIANSYSATLSQPVQASTGTYVFSIWMAREADFLLSNAQLRLEWYDATFSTKVQADTVVDITPALPNDNVWRQYSITGSCSTLSVKGLVPMVYASWGKNEFSGARALKMDLAALDYNGSTEYTDGIPNTWWDRYSISPEDRIAANDMDGDDHSNWEEFVADTDPTSEDSFYPNQIASMTGVGTMILLAGPPTTNSRNYTVYWKTNLMEEGWVPYGVLVPGAANGAAVQLSVTNTAEQRFYRTGVALP